MTVSPTGQLETGGQRGRLPEIAPQQHNPQAVIMLDEVCQQFAAAVGRTIVDDDDFEGLPQPLQHGDQAVVERQQAAFFVVYGDDDRQLGIRHNAIVILASRCCRAIRGRSLANHSEPQASAALAPGALPPLDLVSIAAATRTLVCGPES